ncbi:unnamed protein product, partial [Vitis vinifera]|uniref:Uncharacterized protein n=1 Tax=Vitis vinifera TaxID=29760 RepID=E0CQ73_VITVI
MHALLKFKKEEELVRLLLIGRREKDLLLMRDILPVIFLGTVSASNMLLFDAITYTPSTEKGTVPTSDEDAITDIMEQYGQFVDFIQSRLSKLQEVPCAWPPLLFHSTYP